MPITNYHPVLRAWFEHQYVRPTELQAEVWPLIETGQHVLISSPTGTGKTLAALLPCLHRLVNESDGSEEPGVRVLYITPLKALNNDVLEHLETYEAQMRVMAEEQGLSWPGFKSAVRTGDTPASKRTAMMKHPPDVLVTTPESLYILLTSVRGRTLLKTVQTVIVDEIHHLAASPRGAHLSLSLERLQALVQEPFQRIGLSATARPLERVATFLAGWEKAGSPRSVSIVEETSTTTPWLQALLPKSDIQAGRADGEGMWKPLIDTLLQSIYAHQATVVFVNNRRLCERLSYRLNQAAGYELSRAHHGSVSREQRLETERQMKEGELRAIVATSSLELGLDIGHVDLVIQVDSPKRVSSALQRIGRANHRLDGVSKAVFLIKTPHEAFELAVILEKVKQRDIEHIPTSRVRLDILSQHVVSMAVVDVWSVGQILAVCRGSDSYRELTEGQLTSVIDMLAGIQGHQRPLLQWDVQAETVQGLPSSASAALMGAGTIPSSGGYPVYHQKSRIRIGDLDEEFVNESRTGDVFQLGASSWRIAGITHQAVYVHETNHPFGEIPFWIGDRNGRAFELGRDVGAFIQRVEERIGPNGHRTDALNWLMSTYSLDEASADHILRMVERQHRESRVPTHQRIVAEVFPDDTGKTHVILHSLYGLRLNRTWCTALEMALRDLGTPEFYSGAKDDGIHFVFPAWKAEWLRVLWEVTELNAGLYVQRALPGTQMFAQAFRRQAETALLLQRGWKRVPTWKRRMESDALLRDTLDVGTPLPLIQSAMDACLYEGFDVPNLEAVLARIRTTDISLVVHEGNLPSPWARVFMEDYAETKLYEQDKVAEDVQQILRQFNEAEMREWFTFEDELPVIADAAFGVAPDAWLPFLAERHHLTPLRQLEGMEGLRTVIEELQGIYLPVGQWENSVFPSRLQNYRKQDLDILCATGEVRWLGRRNPGEREARVAFFITGQVVDKIHAQQADTVSHPALLRRLQEQGASFLASLQSGSAMTPSEVVGMLLDLVWEGFVSNDQFAPIRHSAHRGRGKADLLRSGVGRWYAVEPAESTPDSYGDLFATMVKQAMVQYGLVWRGMFEKGPVQWDTAKGVLARMEELGIVGRGLFFEGIPSIQFADRNLQVYLKSERFKVNPESVTVISAVDPANPFGLHVPWPQVFHGRCARKPGNFLGLCNGRWQLWIEQSGKRCWFDGEDLDAEVLETVFSILFRQHGVRKIRIESWNGTPVLKHPMAGLLRRIGAVPNGDSLELWPIQLKTPKHQTSAAGPPVDAKVSRPQ